MRNFIIYLLIIISVIGITAAYRQYNELHKLKTQYHALQMEQLRDAAAQMMMYYRDE